MKQKYIPTFLCIFCFIILLNAQTNYNSFILNKDYIGLKAAGEKALKENSKDSMAYYVIGVSHTNLGHHNKALKYLNKAKEYGLNTLPLKYNLAINYAASDNIKKVLGLLNEVAEGGGNQYKRLEIKEFKKLESNEEFKKIKRKMYINARPCEGDENYRRFDFWVGEWDVFAGGAKVADSKISHSNDKCGILEDYKTFGVFAGNSITYYDRVDKKWKQNWVASGNVAHYTEAEKPYDGDLCFLSQFTNAKGKLVKTKMTFYNNDDGSVRQHLEFSNDDGKTWSTNFDGLYKKKEKKS